MIARLQKSAGDVRVWVRKGEGWKIRQATASSTTSVTIDLDRLTGAAAGIKIVLADTCLVTNTCAGGCGAPSGFCVEDMGVLPVQPLDGAAAEFRVSGNSLYYMGGYDHAQPQLRRDQVQPRHQDLRPVGDDP